MAWSFVPQRLQAPVGLFGVGTSSSSTGLPRERMLPRPVLQEANRRFPATTVVSSRAAPPPLRSLAVAPPLSTTTGCAGVYIGSGAASSSTAVVAPFDADWAAIIGEDLGRGSREGHASCGFHAA
eukprot:CAMPEP_0176035330 /NCGR_PEP_ID=MMETSP0120_2-20121206/17472_1 /TAXON_ID=160619 /ORGANISM="Kryptoperidinium foliaceum, Strain CCMP 1326" /LENGTH=124 /DNA_ID=CAMNT_0017368677 /DNA_START=33 /DNA_END=404 /DNA_ORIENTATION=-